MILFPSVDELLKCVDSRYSLIMLASKRAHEIDKYRADKWRAENADQSKDNHAAEELAQDHPLLLDHYDSIKSVGMALEEIEAGKVTIDTDHTEDLQD
ncbi:MULTISPECIES: DNA-directed RNA polymerase subunit omega [Limosilactobacillus]|mgnify:FL=1|uniref:DNA-directed RNA polymerase subunit omega n=1 Tax=Limosilactobacillus TaxID=2742598 RepID=UPI0024BA6CA6|nr:MULTISPECIES: DNA-directed RNA polymerase subunit omega [Limosilactobacillus]MDM8219905.1 DNA-directed RNA polymerase subunit omega [Limosilactobacillus mucosae]MDM8314480.1 DNA-directed RNA polymerase subunit omega [Limosilactobacillus mucosae]